jgi:hypothetical protein
MNYPDQSHAAESRAPAAEARVRARRRLDGRYSSRGTSVNRSGFTRRANESDAGVSVRYRRTYALRNDRAWQLRKDVREFIRRLEAVGLTVESTPGHYRVVRDGKPLRKANGMPFTLPFSPDTIRWRRAAIVELRKLGIDLER